MLRAVPSIVRIADSTEVVFRSGSFVRAISSICLRVTVPIFSRFGLGDPFSTPAAFLSRSAAGGVLVMKVNERSANTVITTGIFISPMFAVLALNALQNSIMLTPCWPSAGPIGGAGLAFPAGTCSFIYAVIFFAIFGSLASQPRPEPQLMLSPFLTNEPLVQTLKVAYFRQPLSFVADLPGIPAFEHPGRMLQP